VNLGGELEKKKEQERGKYRKREDERGLKRKRD
jgi:hypothetical protein